MPRRNSLLGKGWKRRSGRDLKQNAAKRPLLARTGWFVQETANQWGFNNHPVSAG
jgi:hypothetical protein